MWMQNTQNAGLILAEEGSGVLKSQPSDEGNHQTGVYRPQQRSLSLKTPHGQVWSPPCRWTSRHWLIREDATGMSLIFELFGGKTANYH